ncbi:MAG: pseudouridine synthase [Bacteriovorax sp.]|jgi:23S rRNA pseudouridine2605 synthase
MAKIELERLLSKRSIASRKEAALLILKGLVLVNGRVCKTPLQFVDSRSTIEILGQDILPAKKHYLILNKPKGLIVTRSDERGRPTVYECLKNWDGPLLQAVGRLDQASEGLLLFTNDHEWADRLMDPKTHVKKIYHVQVSTIPEDEVLKKFSDGIMLEEKKTRPAKFELLRTGEKNAWVSVEMHEGRNRQIRKMFATEKIEVLRLIRVQVGDYELGDLPKGKWREL